jgi:F-type H+-transporting ATPase subunit b
MKVRTGRISVPGPVLTAAALLLPLCGLAWAEGGEAQKTVMESGGLPNALWALGTFAALLIILGRYAWKPILKAMEDRERHIADTIERARAQQEESEKLLEGYKNKLLEADAEAAKRVEESRKAAEQVKGEILETARKEAQQYSHQAAAEIHSAKQQALESLYSFAADLATDVAGKIMRKELTADDQRRLVDESLELIHEKAKRN